MSEEISLVAGEAFVPTRLGLLVLDEQAPIIEWVKFGKQLREVDGAVQWLIGDWLNYGETRYGEKYKLAIEATGYDYGTLRGEKWMARRFQLSRRRDNVSWSHHKEVASLDEELANNLLIMAEENRWSEKQLRSEVKKIKKIPSIPPIQVTEDEGASLIAEDRGTKEVQTQEPKEDLVGLTIKLPNPIFEALVKYEHDGGNTNVLIATLLAEWLITNSYLSKKYKLL